jgi:Na+/H+ antiporter NhaC
MKTKLKELVKVISMNLYSIFPSIFVGIISLIVLFYPEEKRHKYYEKKFKQKWIEEFKRQNPKKDELEAEKEFHNKQIQKSTQEHPSPIILTDRRLNTLAIILTLVALFL